MSIFHKTLSNINQGLVANEPGGIQFIEPSTLYDAIKAIIKHRSAVTKEFCKSVDFQKCLAEYDNHLKNAHKKLKNAYDFAQKKPDGWIERGNSNLDEAKKEIASAHGLILKLEGHIAQEYNIEHKFLK